MEDGYLRGVFFAIFLLQIERHIFFNAHRHIACRLVVVAHNLQIEDSQCAPFIHVDFNLFFIVDIGIFQIFQLFPVELEPDGGRQLSAI